MLAKNQLYSYKFKFDQNAILLLINPHVDVQQRSSTREDGNRKKRLYEQNFKDLSDK